ncbi:hypothetical protein BJY01DRAFT_221313 [Aspergillus pseudoustus]|uniref:Tubby C-terminal-like domain-containing protein n=1 Tax=Aspergillus pseudoustus TaxID=1810923 RepID=A0ABR4JAZ9_9EURO
MDPNSKYSDPPPPYEETLSQAIESPGLPAVTVVLDGQAIRDEATSAPLYQLSRSVTTLPRTPPKNSSIIFERMENGIPEKVKSSETVQTRHRHLFYLAHPADAKYRTDIPGYYITCVDIETVGNIHLETSKSRLQKTEFSAQLSPRRTASHRPLFDEAGETSTLFTARPGKWVSSRYIWTQKNGSQVAVEDGKGEEHKLVITSPMKQDVRDALVAVWMLRLWYETAESKEAKREELERLVAPVAHQNWTIAKRVAGLGAFAGVGAG